MTSLRFVRSAATGGYLVYQGDCIGRVTNTGNGWLAERCWKGTPRDDLASFAIVPAPFTRDGLWRTRAVAACALAATAAEATVDPFAGLPR